MKRILLSGFGASHWIELSVEGFLLMKFRESGKPCELKILVVEP